MRNYDDEKKLVGKPNRHGGCRRRTTALYLMMFFVTILIIVLGYCSTETRLLMTMLSRFCSSTTSESTTTSEMSSIVSNWTEMTIHRTFFQDGIATTSNKNKNHHVGNGVSFERTISNFPPHVSFDLNFLPTSFCDNHDKYGDNNCDYPWGTTLIANYSFASGFRMLTRNARAIGEFHLDDKIPWKFNCVLCGQDCVLEVPVIDLKYKFPMPKCPILLPPTAKSYQRTFRFWKVSPTHGWITTKIEGHVTVYKDYSKSDVLTNVDVSIHVK